MQDGIQGAKRRGKPWRTTYPNADAYRPADLVKRDFAASRADQLWFADFTYLRCWEGVVYFAFVIDAYSRAIVGWQFASHMRTDLVLDALRVALTLRAPGVDVALTHHSDAGSQYTSIDYTQTLDDHDLLASIGTVGDAFDNAAAEKLRRQLQDRADPRPRLAQPLPARTRRRRVRRLVQQRAPAHLTRRHPASPARATAHETIGCASESSDQSRKPTKTVSAKPGMAQYVPAQQRRRATITDAHQNLHEHLHPARTEGAVWRTALGIDAHYNLIYVAADDTPLGLARTLVHAGAVRALELDINPDGLPSTSTEDAEERHRPCSSPTQESDDRYLVPDSRDFFAVYAWP